MINKNWYHILSNNKVINNPNFMIYDQPGIPYFGSMINKNYFSNLDFRNQVSINYYLVGGWTNPFEKYWSKWESSPNRDENQQYLKPPPK